jgi:hypothetical protein
MAEIIQVFTVERHLYTRQAIPWTYLILPSNLQRLRERYRFASLEPQPAPAGGVARILGTVGEFKFGDSLQALEQFIVEPDVLQVQISVPSQDSGGFFADVGGFFSDIDPDKGFSEEKLRTKTYQTIAIARLSVPFERLLSPLLQASLHDAVSSKLSLPNAGAVLRVNYTTQSTDFLYLPKPLTIEPRVGTKPEDMIYYTVSPTPFETHRELLEQIESVLKGKPGKARRTSRRPPARPKQNG